MKHRRVITKEVKEIVDRALFLQEHYNDSASLEYDLGADELDVVQIIIDCEIEFGISISEQEEEKIKTFGQLVDIVEEKLSEK